MIVLELSVSAVNVLKYILECVLNFSLVASYLRIADRRDTYNRLAKRNMRKRLTFCSRFRVFSGGFNPGPWTVLLVILTQAMFLFIEYSVGVTTVDAVRVGHAVIYGPNRNISRASPFPVTLAATMCRKEFGNFSVQFRAPVMYTNFSALDLENSFYSRSINGTLFSCEGTTFGETLPLKSRPSFMYQFASVGGGRCKRNDTIISGLIDGVPICFMEGNLDIIRKAITLTKNRNDKRVGALFYLMEYAIPSLLWEPTGESMRDMVISVNGRTKIGPPALVFLVYFVSWGVVKVLMFFDVIRDRGVGSDAESLSSLIPKFMDGEDMISQDRSFQASTMVVRGERHISISFVEEHNIMQEAPSERVEHALYRKHDE